MEFLKKLLTVLGAEMEAPESYGWFHFMFLGIIALATVLLCVFHKKDDPDRVRKIVLITSIVVIVLEIYRLIIFSVSYGGETVTFDFAWYIFPFQFCSTPMYVGLLAGLIKKGRVHNALCAYLGTYALFAGLCVLAYPAQVFVPTIGINIQSLTCHGAMIAIGIYMLYSGHIKLTHKTILGAMAIFCICVLMAATMNEIAYFSGLLETDTFNMFYISRHCAPSLPVYSLVQEVVPYPFCLIIYVGCFSLVAYVILLAAMGIKALAKRRAEKR